MLFRTVTETKEPSEISLEEAKDLVLKSLRVCFLRDCRASANYHLAVVSKTEGTKIEPTKTIDSNWDFARTIKGYE